MKNRDWVYHSLEELLSDDSITEEERQYIMTKSKTTVQVDATHQRTVWVRSNDTANNTFRRGSNSGNTNSGNNNYRQHGYYSNNTNSR